MDVITIELRRIDSETIDGIIRWLRTTNRYYGYSWNGGNNVWNLRVNFTNQEDATEFKLTWL